MTLSDGLRWGLVFAGVAAASALVTALAYVLGPAFAVGGPVAIVAAAAIFRRPIVGVYLALLAIPLYVVELPLGSAGLSASEALLLATAAATVARSAVNAFELRESLHPAHLALAGLVAAAALGLLVAPDTFLVTKVVVLWTSFLVVSILVASASGEELRRILVCLVIAGTVIACIALVNTASAEVVQGGTKVRNRAEGTFTHPNQLAFFLLLSIPVAIALAGRGASWLRALGVAAVGVQLAALMLTFSRSGIIGLAVVFLVLAAWPGFRRVAVVAALGLLLFSAFNLQAIAANRQVSLLAQRLETVTTSSLRGTDPRFKIYATTQRMIADHPWLGVGQRNFPEVSPLYGLQGRLKEGAYEHAHNLFLTLAVESGLPALAFFLAFLVMVGRAALVGLRRRPDAAGTILALAAGLCGILVAGITEYPIGINVVMATVLIEAGALVAYSRSSPVVAAGGTLAGRPWAARVLATSPS